jgi:deoxyadenosine/deoxycytidine kinase
MEYNFIAIEGNIGAGKTSLSTRLAQEMGARLVLEEFENNPFLPAFYAEPERFAFQVELNFLAQRYHQLKNRLINYDLFSQTTLSDYFIQKSWVFAQVTLKEDELELYRTLFEIIAASLPKPDLLVYLYNDYDQLKVNIQKRGRAYEQGIQVVYLEMLQRQYLSYLKTQPHLRCLVLDTQGLDFVNREEDYHWVKDRILETYPLGLTHISMQK